jgi:HPt (histidine-containing phosphotransfer) domain-containing protein
MAQFVSKRRDPAPADAADHAPEMGAAIDRSHLARMTFGDGSLERELLELFDVQAAMLVVRMRAGGAAAVAPLAHTLKGSASGIGAGRVAAAAEAAELAAAASSSECSLAIDRLVQAVEEVRAHIAELLRER